VRGEDLARRLRHGPQKQAQGSEIVNLRYHKAAQPEPERAQARFEASRLHFAWPVVQRVGAFLLLLAATPLLALLFLAVKYDSPGPFFYRQQRPGLRGKPFTAWKIRTMTVGADRNVLLAHAVTSSSPEVTRVGRVLRDLKIDELPQLWNVVRGDMVFVGPRPVATALHEHLERHIPAFSLRLSVPPGLTSLGQVCIEDNDAPERVIQDWSVRFEAERHYLQHRSVGYDLVIICMTLAYCARKLARRLQLRRMTATTAHLPLAAIALFLLGGCAGTLPAQDFEAAGAALARPIPRPEPGKPVPVIDHELVSVDTLPRGEANPVYVLGMGDRVAINVFGEPGMDNLIVQVDGAGQIQLPMIERVAASGLSLAELQDTLTQRYSDHFMEPWVVVQLQEPLSRPLYLLGEFNQPGIVHMTGATNVIQALGAGRGLSAEAYTQGARLIRDDRIAPVDVHALLNNGRMDQNVWLEPNDTVFVPSRRDLRIYVLGAVQQPGAQEFNSAAATLAEAIARSGGPRRGQALLRQVRVIRANSPVSGELFVVDFMRILSGEAMDMILQPGDIVYLPVNGIGGWNDVITAISPTIMLISRALDPFVLAKALEDN